MPRSRKPATSPARQPRAKSPGARVAAGAGTGSAEAMRRLVHELQVHQADLEAQNLALREAHAQLEESRGRYADLFDLAPMVCCTLDSRGRITEINLAGAALLGRERDQLVGRPFLALASLEDPASFRAHFDRCLRERTRVVADVALSPQGGPRRVLQMVATPPTAPGDPVGGLRAAFLDVTDQRRAEHERDRLLTRAESARREAEAANRLKDVFLAKLSHELRTPLAALMMWENVLATPGIDEATRHRALAAIHESARTQSRLIEDLVDVARSLDGRLVLLPERVDVVPLLQAAIAAAAPSATASGLRLETRLDPDTGSVLADPTRLLQIASNLLANAIKFTGRGGLIELRCARVGTAVEITVSDTGRGIAPAFAPRLFVPFSQADDSDAARQHGGLGLGLAIVRQLVELHGGTVRGESAGPGQGAAFIVSLPARAEPEAPRLIAPPRGLDARGADVRGLRILVVDDEATMRDGVAVVLRQGGAHVTTAGSVSQAVNELERLEFDVVVTDLAMPGEDGYVLLQKVRARAAPHRPAIVALTACARATDQARAAAAGFDMFVPKPVDAWHLIGALALAAAARSAPRTP